MIELRSKSLECGLRIHLKRRRNSIGSFSSFVYLYIHFWQLETPRNEEHNETQSQPLKKSHLRRFDAVLAPTRYYKLGYFE